MNNYSRNKKSVVYTKSLRLIVPVMLLVALPIISLFGLSGCNKGVKRNINVVSVQKPMKSYKPNKADLINALSKLNIPVVQKKNEVIVVLSNDKLFQDDSSNLKPGNDFILKVIAMLMNQDRKTSAGIVMFSDHPNRILVNDRANNIANILWGYGVDARLLYTRTYNQLPPWMCRDVKRCTLIQYGYYPKVSMYD